MQGHPADKRETTVAPVDGSHHRVPWGRDVVINAEGVNQLVFQHAANIPVRVIGIHGDKGPIDMATAPPPLGTSDSREPSAIPAHEPGPLPGRNEGHDKGVAVNVVEIPVFGDQPCPLGQGKRLADLD